MLEKGLCMIVKKAILKNYSRFYVSGIKYIEYEPDKKIQSIIGQNGSGKSSLLKELIPNVDNVKNDYDKHGYKHITYEHNNDIIELKYDRDSDKHFFIVNNEELNQAGIITTQKILIEQYFNLTKDIHGILLSTTIFTKMSTNERKKWFTEILSDIDYTYVLELYDASKFRIKELTSFIKLTRSKLIKDDDFLNNLDKGYEDDLLFKINKLNNILESLLSEKEPYKDINKEMIYNKLDTLIDSSKSILNNLNKYDKHLITNISNNTISKTTELELLLKQKEILIEKINKVDDLKINENDTKTSIVNKLNTINKELNILKNINTYNIDPKLMDKVFHNFIKTLPYIQDSINNICDLKNSYNIITVEEYNKILITMDKLNLNKLNLNNKLTLINNEIKELNDLSKDKITCPKCTHIFIPNYDEHTLETKINIQNKLEEDINTHTKEIKSLSKKINIHNEHKENKEYFKTLFTNNELSSLLIYILKETNDLDNVNILSNLINKINIDLNTLIKYPKFINEKNEYENKLVIFNKINDNKLKNIFNKIKELQNDYTTVIENINILNKELSVLKDINLKINKLTPMLVNIKNIVSKNRLIINNEIKKEKNIYLNKILLDLKSEIHILENDLITINNIKNRYKDLEIELLDYENRLKAIKVLLDVLSPNKGIIGKSVVGLINDIILRMNNLINRVWKYDIKILPCDINKNDLTYKFPVKLNNIKDIKDVSEGSSAIQEIINLSFKVIAMEYLGMLQYPLILDEYATKMDPKHRIEAYNLIEDLSKEYFSQVFMVSHFESMYSRFIDNDVIILSNENLEYGGVFNKVIKIK